MPALTARVAAVGLLAVLFAGLSWLVGMGDFGALDQRVATSVGTAWSEPLHGLFQAIALLGGIEATTLVAAGIGVHLLRGGYRRELWALAALPAAVVLELLYKKLLFHPGPAAGLAHADGPSFSQLFEKGIGNSYPSGHMTRTVVAYGLLAFVFHRLGPQRAARLAAPLAVAVFLLMAFDRVYLEVHWESDVLGGMLLGGIWLLVAMIWLDRPRPEGG